MEGPTLVYRDRIEVLGLRNDLLRVEILPSLHDGVALLDVGEEGARVGFDGQLAGLDLGADVGGCEAVWFGCHLYLNVM